jgi:hypothetical protein
MLSFRWSLVSRLPGDDWQEWGTLEAMHEDRVRTYILTRFTIFPRNIEL